MSEKKMKIILNDDEFNIHDPHGYCQGPVPFCEGLFRDTCKRGKLNEDINEIHSLNDAKIQPPMPSGSFNKSAFRTLVDNSLRLQKLERPSAAIKRQLFRTPRVNPRKDYVPQKKKVTFFGAYEYRRIRKQIGRRKFKKSYLNEARIAVEKEIKKENTLKRRASSSSSDSSNSRQSKKVCTQTPDGKVFINTDDGMIAIAQNDLKELCKFHEKMVRQHPPKIRTESEQIKRNLNTQACRLSRRASKLAIWVLNKQRRERCDINLKVMEKTIRMIYYLSALLDTVKYFHGKN